MCNQVFTDDQLDGLMGAVATVRWTEGDVVRKLRALVGWTLQDLSAASGVNIQVIHRLEKGITKEAKRDTLARLAGAFGLSSRQLLDAVPEPADLPIQTQGKARTRRMAKG